MRYASGDYTTTYLPTEAQNRQIYNLLADLDVTSYADIYDPQMGKRTSFPDMTLFLSVSTDSIQKAITAGHIAVL